MIKPDELRIGNHVTVKDDPEEKLKTVAGLGGGNRVWLENDTRTYIIDELSGIELTEYWLEKLGFDFIEHLSWGSNDATDTDAYELAGVRIDYYPTSQTVSFREGKDEFSYIHQLENAFNDAQDKHTISLNI